MGEVWKARDPRLSRSVAIKVAKTAFSDRFEREARAIAALNHPYICTLHDVGPNYLVMELVEGTPLKGPLPAEKAVEYASQRADRGGFGPRPKPVPLGRERRRGRGSGRRATSRW